MRAGFVGTFFDAIVPPVPVRLDHTKPGTKTVLDVSFCSFGLGGFRNSHELGRSAT